MQFLANMHLNISLVLVLCVSSLCAPNTLCSNNVLDHKCLCKEFTNEYTNLPRIEAKCILLSMRKFPDLSQLPVDLTGLDLSFNNIQILEASNGTSSSTIEILILKGNEITDVRANFFNGMPALGFLDLSHNNLVSLSNDDKDGHVFRQLKNLVVLDLSYNNFKEFPAATFELLPLLKTLDLGYNPLGEFLTRFTDVLSGTLRVSPNISHLSLKNVGLKNICRFFFYPFQNIKLLELQDNSFEYIPTVPTSLQYLDLSGNKLTFVSASSLKYSSLKVLLLSRMPSLTSIHPYAFHNLKSLETLILTDCPNVREFTDLAFGVPSKTMDIHLTTLNLARNGITSLNSTYAHMFRRMQHIDLRHNPWDCGCDILWLQEFWFELFKESEIRYVIFLSIF